MGIVDYSPFFLCLVFADTIAECLCAPQSEKDGLEITNPEISFPQIGRIQCPGVTFPEIFFTLSETATTSFFYRLSLTLPLLGLSKIPRSQLFYVDRNC